jgi:hypothetical protein
MSGMVGVTRMNGVARVTGVTSSRVLRIAAGLLSVAAVTMVLLTALAAGADASRRVALGTNSAKPSTDVRYYRSSVSAIQPAVPGLTVTAQGDGSVSLTNDTGKTVTVLGYAHEPYLRITAHGVDENLNSLSAVLNDNVSRALPLGTTTDDDRPRWRHVDDGSTVIWRDYRTRWGSAQRPAIVTADPHHPHVVSGWTLQLTVDGRPVLAKGIVEWTGTPWFSQTQLKMLTTGLLTGVALLLLLLSLRNRTESPVPAFT